MWQVFNPEAQEYQSFGVASYKEYQLPIGTKVKGHIKGDLFTTARLDIDHPQLKDTEIVIGNMTKYPTVGHEFRNESATIVLSQQQNVPPQPLITINGKKLGQLDNNAVELFKKHGKFKDNLTFEVSLNSYGEGNAKEIIATTPQGASFKIEKSHFLADKDLKEAQFLGDKVKVSLSLVAPKKKVMVANIKQSDGSLLPIGEFTTNQKLSKEALTKVGLFKEGATFEAKINSRVTAARIEIDSESIQYPERGQWQGTSQKPAEIELDPTAKRFIEALTTQPTLLHRSPEQWQRQGQTETLPTLGLSVDLNRVAATQQILEKYKIPYKLLPLDDPTVKMETERSYGVFKMVEADVPPKVRQSMEKAAKGVLDGNMSNGTSPYHERLASILPLSQQQQQKRIENSKSVFQASLPPPLPTTKDINEIPSRQENNKQNLDSDLTKPNEVENKKEIIENDWNEEYDQNISPEDEIEYQQYLEEYYNKCETQDISELNNVSEYQTIEVDNDDPESIDRNDIKSQTDALIAAQLANMTIEESSHQSDNFDNIRTKENSSFMSIDDIPSDPEFNINILMEQQRKTELVAPIALELLKVEDQQNSPTRHFQGKEITIGYDGHHLTITNNDDNGVKMKARFVGVDAATRKNQWLSELPHNSPGLTEADVEMWTSDEVLEYIKDKIIGKVSEVATNNIVTFKLGA